MIALIAAVARNGTIGKDGKIPWRLPEDLKRFKALTMGHVLVMGRKTYESIGKQLPGRTTLVLTRRSLPSLPEPPPKWEASLEAGLEPSLDSALAWCRRFAPERNIFICGGAEVYREALEPERSIVDKVYLTRIEAHYEGDTCFPRWPGAPVTRHDGAWLAWSCGFRLVRQELREPTPEFPHLHGFYEYERDR